MNNSASYSTSNNLAVLILSCDKYSDVWVPFFCLFFKFWPDCPYPVYLVSNLKVFEDSRVVTICTGFDRDWSTNTIQALNQIPESYVLACMEDYLLTKPVNTQAIERILQYVINKQIGCFRLFPVPGPTHGDLAVAGYESGYIKKGTDYSVSLQAAIWNKEIFQKIMLAGESAWELEIKGSQRSSYLDVDFMSLRSFNMKQLPFIYFCTGVVKGYWLREAVDLCNSYNISVDLQARSMEPILVRWKRTVIFLATIINLAKYIKKKIKIFLSL